MKNLFILIIIAALFVSCREGHKTPAEKENGTKSKVSTQTKEEKIDVNLLEPPYQVKEDGLYIYADGARISVKKADGGTKIVQPNYAYIRVPPAWDKIRRIEWARTYINCDASYQVTDEDMSTRQREGYLRNEKEIKPEDDRPEILFKTRTIPKTESRLGTITEFDVIPISEFKEVSQSEFLKNGIVIIGQHISRVVIKSLHQFPQIYPDFAVARYVSYYDCSGFVRKDVKLPNVIADFKKVRFNENVFEFIEKEDAPNNRGYLSEEHFIHLTNNIHKLIPRYPFDGTIHKAVSYPPGYYLIEYHNGNKLYSYQCIRIIINPAPRPGLVPPLEVKPFETIDNTQPTEMYRLVIADFKSIKEAESFIYKNQLSEVLIYRSDKGEASIGCNFNSKTRAESEMKRYTNRGFNKDKMRIIKY